MKDTAPVILFVYNRPMHTQKTINALKENILAPQTDLYIFSDGPKANGDTEEIQAVREIINNVTGFQSVKVSCQETNIGLAKSIIQGVSKVINDAGRAIILEDDLITSADFLSFMNQSLKQYADMSSVISISGYCPKLTIPGDYEYSVFFNPRNCSSGWATWKDRWELVNWTVPDYEGFQKSKSRNLAFKRGGDDLPGLLEAQMSGNIDSWAIRWSYTHFINHGVSVMPVKSYVDNIGWDGSGTNCPSTNSNQVEIGQTSTEIEFPTTIYIDERIMNSYRKLYKRPIMPIRVIQQQIRNIKKIYQ